MSDSEKAEAQIKLRMREKYERDNFASYYSYEHCLKPLKTKFIDIPDISSTTLNQNSGGT